MHILCLSFIVISQVDIIKLNCSCLNVFVLTVSFATLKVFFKKGIGARSKIEIVKDRLSRDSINLPFSISQIIKFSL